MGFVFLIFLVIIALPVAALVLAIKAFRWSKDLSAWAGSLNDDLIIIRSRIDELGARLDSIERGGAVMTREPAAEEAPAPAPAPAPEEPESELILDEVVPLFEAPPVTPAEIRILPSPPPLGEEAAEPMEAASAEPAPAASKALRGPGLERQLGTRVAVWVGAAALALAGGFLVKYSIERQLIGPTARVLIALVFGVGLIAVAEWLYRRYAALAQGLAAAGIAVLYAALLAGVRLWSVFPSAVGFIGMLLTTAAAVLLSLRHGQMVAILGLLGGFFTPILIGSDQQRPWTLLLYLALIQAGLLVVSRRKKWWPVAALTLVGAMGWALLWMADLAAIGGDTHHIALLLLASMVSLVVSAGAVITDVRWGDPRVPLGLTWGGVGLGVILLGALVDVGSFGLVEWAFLGIVGAGCIALGRLEPRYEGLAWLASLSGAALFLLWGIRLGIEPVPSAIPTWPFVLFSLDLEAAPGVVLWRVAVVLAALFAGGSYWAMWKSVRPVRWAALATVSALAYLLAAYGALEGNGFPIPWGLQALGLAALFAGLAVPVIRRCETLADGPLALAALAVGVTAFVSLAVPLELERAWITVAWALEIPALAWIGSRLRVPELGKLAWALGVLVGARLLLNPAILDYPIGEGPFFNWLLYGYGVPVAAFVAGARLFRRDGETRLADALEVGAVLLGFAYLTLTIRHYFHPGDLTDAHFVLAEWGAYTVAWLLYGLSLLALGRRTENALLTLSGVVIGMLALAQGLLAQGTGANPLGNLYEVGDTLIFNRILLVYGLPAVLAVLLSRAFRRLELRTPQWIAGGAALVFAFLTLSLEVRQAFHGEVLSTGTTSNAELYTYSLVWVLFALALLVTGIVTRGSVARYGSAVIMLVAVAKVFLVDTAQLQGLYRVFSLFGLGVTLMVLAYLYQRFVFREP